MYQRLNVLEQLHSHATSSRGYGNT